MRSCIRRQTRFATSSSVDQEIDDETLEMLLLLLLADGDGRTAKELMAAVRRWLATTAEQ
jgi:hypothetical protein